MPIVLLFVPSHPVKWSYTNKIDFIMNLPGLTLLNKEYSVFVPIFISGFSMAALPPRQDTTFTAVTATSFESPVEVESIKSVTSNMKLDYAAVSTLKDENSMTLQPSLV